MKIFSIYPPGNLYQRGEDRCQASISESLTVTQRACNDLGYVTSIAQNLGFEGYLCDYPSENKKLEDFKIDLNKINPDIILISSTIATLPADSEICKIIKEYNIKIKVIVKGSVFSTIKQSEISKIENYLDNIDFAVKGEVEEVISKLLICLKNEKDYTDIKGLIYKKDGKWIVSDYIAMVENLDDLPFPDRSKIKNQLYIRPDTGNSMATLETSRGCPSQCIYCLTPIISGKKIRFRSPESIIKEIKECVEKYKIKDFFFRSDTFTINKNWVMKLCEMMIEEKLKINWVANSRVKPLDLETLQIMKKAGCWLIAFGFEVGSNQNLKKIKKGTDIKDAFNAVKYSRIAGLQTYGYFMFGFPWETKKDVFDTINLSLKLNCDFVEYHLATAFKDTELYKSLNFDSIPVGLNYFSSPNRINENITIQELLDYRSLAIKNYYLRYKYIIKRLLSINNLYQIKAYFYYGFKVLKTIFKIK